MPTEKKEFQSVTTVTQSRRLVGAGLSPYTADCYFEKSNTPEAGEYHLHLVPMAQRQTDLEERDRFFKVNQRYLKSGIIVPAWTMSRLWQIVGGMNLNYYDDPFEVLVRRTILLLQCGDIKPEE